MPVQRDPDAYWWEELRALRARAEQDEARHVDRDDLRNALDPLRADIGRLDRSIVIHEARHETEREERRKERRALFVGVSIAAFSALLSAGLSLTLTVLLRGTGHA